VPFLLDADLWPDGEENAVFNNFQPFSLISWNDQIYNLSPEVVAV
jgi:hypothetical protein